MYIKTAPTQMKILTVGEDALILRTWRYLLLIHKIVRLKGIPRNDIVAIATAALKLTSSGVIILIICEPSVGTFPSKMI